MDAFLLADEVDTQLSSPQTSRLDELEAFFGDRVNVRDSFMPVWLVDNGAMYVLVYKLKPYEGIATTMGGENEEEEPVYKPLLPNLHDVDEGYEAMVDRW